MIWVLAGDAGESRTQHVSEPGDTLRTLPKIEDDHISRFNEQVVAIGQGIKGIASRFLMVPPLYLSTAALIAGDALGNLGVFVPVWAVVVTAIAAVAIFILNRPKPGVAVALLGLISAATIPLSNLLAPESKSQTVRQFRDGSLVSLEGWVVRAPENQGADRTYLYVNLQNSGFSGSPAVQATGLVRVTALGQGSFHVGDRLSVTGKIRFPRNDGDENEFDYRAWLMRQGIAATMVAAPYGANKAPSLRVIGHREMFPASQFEAVRERIAKFIDGRLSYPENAEMRALIIGDRGGIDEYLCQPFALTGMAHLLVISGLHLGFVAVGAFFVARLLMAAFPVLMVLGYANKIAAIAAMAAVSAYASVAGGHVSTIRAFLMVLTFGCAILFDRSRELMASLALAALIICFAIPGSTADIGFQLSFASVGVILLGMRRFSAWWRWHYANPLSVRREPSTFSHAVEWICGYLAVSFWAMVGTAPLTAFHFNQFSLVGLVANPVVVPIMGFGAVVCGLIAAGCSFIYLPLAGKILLVASSFAALGTWLARWFVTWPFAWERTFTPTLIELVIGYGFILLWLTAPLAGDEVLRAMRGRRLVHKASDANGVAVASRNIDWIARWRGGIGAALIAALILDVGWWTYQRFFNSELRVTFLSVGEGDAAVVRFPGKRVMLIDGGGSFRSTFDPGERIVAPYLWSHKIMHLDYIALSHPDRDHFGGLIFIVRNFAPAQFWTAGAESEDASYGELLSAITASGARRLICDSEGPPMTIAGVKVRCVGPLHGVSEVKRNNSSMILRIAYGHESFLFTGDVEAKGEHELVASSADLRATILKVPHHGSRTSSSAEFIEAVHPQVAVFSLGYLNRFNFPASNVLLRYEDNGIEVMRTDYDGAVSVVAGPDAYRVATFRQHDRVGIAPFHLPGSTDSH